MRSSRCSWCHVCKSNGERAAALWSRVACRNPATTMFADVCGVFRNSTCRGASRACVELCPARLQRSTMAATSRWMAANYTRPSVWSRAATKRRASSRLLAARPWQSRRAAGSVFGLECPLLQNGLRGRAVGAADRKAQFVARHARKRIPACGQIGRHLDCRLPIARLKRRQEPITDRTGRVRRGHWLNSAIWLRHACCVTEMSPSTTASEGRRNS